MENINKTIDIATQEERERVVQIIESFDSTDNSHKIVIDAFKQTIINLINN